MYKTKPPKTVQLSIFYGKYFWLIALFLSSLFSPEEQIAFEHHWRHQTQSNNTWSCYNSIEHSELNSIWIHLARPQWWTCHKYYGYYINIYDATQESYRPDILFLLASNTIYKHWWWNHRETTAVACVSTTKTCTIINFLREIFSVITLFLFFSPLEQTAFEHHWRHQTQTSNMRPCHKSIEHFKLNNFWIHSARPQWWTYHKYYGY